MAVDDDIDQGIAVGNGRQTALTIEAAIRLSRAVDAPAHEVAEFDVEFEDGRTRRTAKAGLAMGISQPFVELDHRGVMGRTHGTVVGVEGDRRMTPGVEGDNGQTVQFCRPLVDIPASKAASAIT